MLNRIYKLKTVIVALLLAFFSIITFSAYAAENRISVPINSSFVLGMSYHSDQYLNALASASNVGIGTSITTWPTVVDSTQRFMFITPSQANYKIRAISE